MRQRLDQYLFKPTLPDTLGMFRIVLGLALCFEAFRIMATYDAYYLTQDFIFRWPGLEFLPLPGESMFKAISWVLALCGLLVTLGAFPGPAALTFGLIYGYILFLCPAYYNNHYYLITLLCLLLPLVDSAAAYSVLNKQRRLVYRWNLLLFQLMIFMVYFFAATAKIHYDWLSGETIRAIFRYSDTFSGGHPFYRTELAIWVYTYGGLLFDLFVGFMLFYSGTKRLAIVLIFLFHIPNALLLGIGVFPYFMMGATVLFFDVQLVEKWMRKVQKKTQIAEHSAPLPKLKKNLVPVFLAIWLVIHLLLPIRHHFIAGNVDWTGEGRHFAWRMKIAIKTMADFKMDVIDRRTGHNYTFDIPLNNVQVNELLYNPRVILQLRDHAIQLIDTVDASNLLIYANSHVSMNGRMPAQQYDTTFNLASAVLTCGHNTFLTLRPGQYP